MRRKKFWVSLGLLVVFVTAGATTLGLLTKHTPAFYEQASVPPSEQRVNDSGEFVNRFTGLMNSVLDRYPDWWGVFTSAHINAFLQEDFLQSWGGDNNLPDGFHDLRVQIEEGRLRLGCRYGQGFFSTVLSIDVKMWLIANEVNLIGVELLELRAGALPISKQNVLGYITEAARRANIDVKWYHRQNNPVAIFRLQANQVRPTIQIQRFELKPGKMVIVGRSTEGQVSYSVDQASSK
jgi:hypothetical protein